MQPDLRLVDRRFESSYAGLCRIARRLRASTRSFDAAALVHETYLRFRDTLGARSVARGEFLFLMGLAMRTVARDRRRRERALKRGGGRVQSLGEVEPLDPRRLAIYDRGDVAALRRGLRRLRHRHPCWFEAVAHHDLAGRTLVETARRMRITEGRVRSYRRSAVRWLRRDLGADRARGSEPGP